MVEAADLNLLTYVIAITHNVMANDGSLVYLAPKKDTSGNARMALVIGGIDNIPVSCSLKEATIFNYSEDAIKMANKLSKLPHIITADVHPVSKKVFFEAALKGDR